MRMEHVACRAFLCVLVTCGFSPLVFGQAIPGPGGSTAMAAYRQGQAALSRKDLLAAQHAFEQALRLAPHFEQGHAALGMVLLQLGRAGNAVPELEAARALNRADLNVSLNLGIAYQQAGRSREAVPLFASVVSGLRTGKQAVPPAVWAGYARALAATGQLTQAATALQAAVRGQPKDATLHGDLGSIYAQQKDWSHAEDEFKTEIALDSSGAIGHLRLGLAMQAEGEAGAAHEIEIAGQMAPQDAGIQLEWAKSLAMSGDDRRAIPLLERLSNTQPGSTAIADQLAQAYQRSGRVPEAIDLFKRVLAGEPENAFALTNLGVAYTQMQNAKDAVPVLQKAVALNPEDATAREDLAAAYVQLNQFGDAATELRAGLKLQPNSPQLHYDLGLALKDADDAGEAVPELEKAETLDATAPEPPYLLGVLYLQAGRYPEASRALQTSLRLDSENGDAWATLGSVYNKLDQLPAAVDALHEAIKQLPSQPDPHLTLAAVLTRQNLATEAAAERKQAATLMRANMNRQRAEVATNAGRSLLKKGDLAGAVRQFQDALGYDAQYTEAHLALAEAYQAQGRSAEAASERQKAASEPTSVP